MRGTCFLFMLSCAGCITSSGRSSDPFFDRAWNQDASNRAVQSRAEYLRWVDSFYEGAAFQPGWVQRQAELCGPLAPAEALFAEPRLETLGRVLAAEWAKDNRVRRIDSDMLRRIAGILSEARDAGRLIAAVDEVLEEAASRVAGDPRLQSMRR